MCYHLYLSIYICISQVWEAHPCNSGFPDWKEAGYPLSNVSGTGTWPAAQCM